MTSCPLTALAIARECAQARLKDAKDSGCTQAIHKAQQAVRDATHALMREELR